MRRTTPQRKPTRLSSLDYAEPGWYFVTVCTHDRERSLSVVQDGNVVLTALGSIARDCWLELPRRFRHVDLDDLVVMPDHIHGIISLNVGAARRQGLSEVVGAFKSESARRINNIRGTRGAPVWQRSFYDHAIRNAADLERVRAYIESNPFTWSARDASEM